MNSHRNESLPEDVQPVIDAHLDAVDRALAGQDMTRSERQSICDEIEGQIHEMLQRRAGDQPTRADAEAVLVELDPPEAYGEEATAPAVQAETTEPKSMAPAPDKTKVAMGWVSLGLVLLAPVLMTAGAAIASLSESPGAGDDVQGAFSVIAIFFTITGLILGAISWRQSVCGRIGASIALTMILLLLLAFIAWAPAAPPAAQ